MGRKYYLRKILFKLHLLSLKFVISENDNYSNPYWPTSRYELNHSGNLIEVRFMNGYIIVNTIIDGKGSGKSVSSTQSAWDLTNELYNVYFLDKIRDDKINSLL